MSIRWMSKAWEETELKGNRLLLFLALCDYANDEGLCYPSIRTLSKRVRVDPRSVQRLLSGLVNDGFVQRQINQAKGGANLYQLKLGGDRSVTLDRSVTPRVTEQSSEPSMEPSKNIDIWFTGFQNLMIQLNLPKPRALNAERKKLLRQRIKEDKGEMDILNEISISDFLSGKSASWSVTIDWILKKVNWNKVLDGNYRNREEKNKNDHTKTWWKRTNK